MFRLAVTSIRIRRAGKPADCVAGCTAAIAAAASRGADLVVLPEEPDVVSGRPAGEHVLDEHPIYRAYREEAVKHRVGVIGSVSAKVLTADGGSGAANVGFLIDRRGVLAGAYRKQHPAPSEEYIVTAPEIGGERFPVFEFDGVRIGIAICMDIHFPEMFRIYMLKGVDLVCMPTMYLDYTGDMLESVEKARAADNQMYLALSRYIDQPFLAGKNMGYAKVIAPDGRVIASTGHTDGVAVAEFDPTWRMPFWEAGYRDLREMFERIRNPAAYGEIVAPKGETLAGMVPLDAVGLPPTERLALAFRHAREEARRSGSADVRSYHVLLGLVRDQDNRAAQLLDRAGSAPDTIRTIVREVVASLSDQEPEGESIETILARAADEARSAGSHHLDVEHVLLALAGNRANVAAQALAVVGVDYRKLRAVVERLRQSDGDAA